MINKIINSYFEKIFYIKGNFIEEYNKYENLKAFKKIIKVILYNF